MGDLVVIKTYSYGHEAYDDKNLLESGGINCFIKDEMTVQMNNFYSNAIGGVKLVIDSDDYDEAFKLLFPDKYNQRAKYKELDVFAASLGFKEKCPYCGSDNVGKSKSPGLITIISILLFAIPLFFTRKTYHCYSCEKDWRIG